MRFPKDIQNIVDDYVYSNEDKKLMFNNNVLRPLFNTELQCYKCKLYKCKYLEVYFTSKVKDSPHYFNLTHLYKRYPLLTEQNNKGIKKIVKNDENMQIMSFISVNLKRNNKITCY